MTRPQPSAAGLLRGLAERYETWLMLALLGMYAALAVCGAAHNGSTFDEGAHLVAGYSYWATGDYRLNPEHPPLAKLLAALPLRLRHDVVFSTRGEGWANANEWTLARQFLYFDNRADSLLFWARLPIVLVSCLLGCFIYRWTRELAGRTGAVLALLMFVWTPDFLAHGALVTTDAAVATFVFIAAYWLWRCVRCLTLTHSLWCGLALGAALASKFSALVFVPVFMSFPVLRALYPQPLPLRWSASSPERSLVTLPARATAVLFACLVTAVSAWLVLWAAYGFHDSALTGGVPSIQPRHKMPPGAEFVRWLASPLPNIYFTSLLQTFQGAQVRTSFLLGKVSNYGFYNYFWITLLVKTPLPELALLAYGCAYACMRVLRRAWSYALPLIAAGAYFTIALRAHLNIGHRHLLPMYPFLLVLAGCAAAPLLRRVWSSWLLAGAYAWLACGTWHITPSFLTYFNEVAGGSRGGMAFLVDSNLDWGQDLPELKRWMDRQGIRKLYLSYFGTGRPEYYGIDYVALPSYGQLDRAGVRTIDLSVSEYVAVSATNLQKVYLDAHNTPPEFLAFLDYLRDKREPTALIGGSIYVYHLKRRLTP